MTYIGEHQLPGQIGNLFVSFAFVFALLSSASYFISTFSKSELKESWKKIGKISFLISAAASFIFIGTMFYLLVQQYFEYDYIWEHSNSEMTFRYILVCFWGGQEGSFMLWIFWHLVLSLIVLRKANEWTPYLMTVFALVQAFLVSMLLGIYIGDYRLGSSPFALSRESVEGFGTLWSLIPDYLTLDPRFADGKGLNPLLQNYWMVIHPPTLFLGFALTVIPFGYAIAGLWRREFTSWIKPAIPWTFSGIAILGIGVLMGGAWAYESLSFGGFWAWDPVENASLVPWLTLVGAGHLLLVNRNQHTSVYSAFFFTLISFILILYSTFLTRSGVLGDTSVHSFTGDGMLGQLLAYLLFFIWLSFMLLLVNPKAQRNYTLICLAIVVFGFMVDMNTELVNSDGFILTWRGVIILVTMTVSLIFLINNYTLHFPRQTKEEPLWSREFWMFVGSLVLVLSAAEIIFHTSLPVINILFNTDLALVEQKVRNEFYNGWQTPFAVIIGFLIGFAQFLKYKENPFTEVLKKIAVSVFVTLVLTIIIGLAMPLTDRLYNVMLFATLFSIVANFDYWIRILKGKIKSAGSAIAHIGIGMILLGALISQNRQEVISETVDGYNLQMINKDFSNNSEIQLFKGDTTKMGKYFVCYTGKTKEDNFLRFNIDYFEQEPAQYKVGETVIYEGNVYTCTKNHQATDKLLSDIANWKLITAPTKDEYFAASPWFNVQCGKKMYDLKPFVQLNKMNNVAEPGTKHFIDHDIFTHIMYADLREDTGENEMPPYEMSGKIGDTLFTPGFFVIIEGISELDKDLIAENNLDSGTLGAVVDLMIYDIWDVQTKFGIKARPVFVKDSTVRKKFDADVPEIRARFSVTSLTPKKDTASVKTTKDTSHAHSSDTVTVKKGKFLKEETIINLEVKTPEFIVMHAIRFPWINILWIGCLVMFFGTVLAVYSRIRSGKKTG